MTSVVTALQCNLFYEDVLCVELSPLALYVKFQTRCHLMIVHLSTNSIPRPLQLRWLITW